MNETERIQAQTREEWLAEYTGETEMPLNVSDEGGNEFQQVPQGTHLAISNMVIDLGWQESPYGTKHQLYIRWELPQERITFEKDGEKHEGPMSIGSFYTASLNEKANLRRDLEGWRGRSFTESELESFNVFNVLGAPCQITVTHNDKGKARVSSVTGWPKGLEKPKPENPLVKYSPDEPDQYDDLQDWLKEIIQKQIKREQPKPAAHDDFEDSDIPF